MESPNFLANRFTERDEFMLVIFRDSRDQLVEVVRYAAHRRNDDDSALLADVNFLIDFKVRGLHHR